MKKNMELEIITKEEKNNIETAKLTVKDWEAQYMGMRIGGIEDKLVYTEINKGRLAIKKERLSLEKRFKGIIKPHEDKLKEAKDTFKDFLGSIKPIEDHLSLEEEKYEALVEAKRKEEFDAKVKKTMNRAKTMLDLGFKFDGVSYKYRFDPNQENISLETRIVNDLSIDDLVFENHMKEVRENNRKLMEEKLLREAEIEAERKKIAEEEARKREELIIEKKKLAEERKAFEAEKKKVSDEEAKAIIPEKIIEEIIFQKLPPLQEEEMLTFIYKMTVEELEELKDLAKKQSIIKGNDYMSGIKYQEIISAKNLCKKLGIDL